MLELKNISKVYEIGNKNKGTYLRVDALKGVSINFRKHEFVSILGQSGCGKTTLLNIIGGLDKYTKGDLIINGKSTKQFKDKDWDTYRNHSIGFVFQSYNLIPHQTVLENVQLALTLSGISKKEREKRAKEVLKRVGLKDKIHSKPNQLSGGQMQRVAIARALVNDPDIILADEPTGALDTKTSVQIMEILKEISNEKLIVMVTHNPELANDYSSRIIQLSDGELISDSNPIIKDETVDQSDDRLISIVDDKELTKKEIRKKNKKKRMSYWTALSLSFKNLLTKKARTILVSFAGSIGIIGIALILSLSSGFQLYINNVQKDTLSTYPITINAATVDYTAMLQMVINNADGDNTPSSDDKIHSDDVIVNMFKSVLEGAKSNDLKKFKVFLDNNEEIEKYTTGIQYTYNIGLNIYDVRTETREQTEETIVTQLNPNNMFSQGVQAFFTATAINRLVEDQLVTMKGKDPATVTTDEKREIIDNATEEEKNMAYAIVMSDQGKIADEIVEVMGDFKSITGGSGNSQNDVLQMFSGMDLGIWNEMIDNPKLLQSQYDVVAMADGVNKDTLFDDLKANEIVLVVDENGNLSDYNLYALGIKTSPTIEEVASGLATNIDGYKIEPSSFNHSDVIGKKYPLLLETDYYQMIGTNGTIDNENGVLVDIRKQIKSNPTDQTKMLTQSQYDAIVKDLLDKTEVTLEIKAIVKAKEGVSASAIGGAIGYSHELTELIVNKQNAEIVAKGLTGEQVPTVDLTKPNSINIYCVDFESKEEIERIISEYNEGKPEEDQITYTDLVGVMMSSITTIINAISYVLIAFVSISLIVSSIMIGIITYISVLERTKEIGVLRSVGASKKDVKRVFTAESLIIGTLSGVFGIIVTLILNIPINLIITLLSGLTGIASLPVGGAIVLIGISMLLTFIAGLIPAQFASKKDPVVALRTE